MYSVLRRYHSYSPHRSTASASPVGTEKSVLFDPLDPDTMTRPKDVSTKWSDATVKLAKDSSFGVLTVYDNSFGYDEALKETSDGLKKMYPKLKVTNAHFPRRDHCDFCGQNITYVAVVIRLVGPARTPDGVHQIGCDCLGKIFGKTWYGYRSAESAKKSLMELAKVRSRKVKYATQYMNYLMWMAEIPSDTMKQNTFLSDMYTILTTGSKVFTRNMEAVVVRLMKDPRYTKKGAEELKAVTASILTRIDALLELVAFVDGTVSSTMDFVRSVRANVEKYGKLTEGQKNALNTVHTRYTDRKHAMLHKTEVKNALGLPNTPLVVPTAPTAEIPW